MPIKFCSNCGTKINFELQAPEKCPKCGKSINSALKAQAQSNDYKPYNQITKTSSLEDSDEIDLRLIDQIKTSFLRELRNIDITVENIPEFRVPISKIIEEKIKNNN